MYVCTYGEWIPGEMHIYGVCVIKYINDVDPHEVTEISAFLEEGDGSKTSWGPNKL